MTPAEKLTEAAKFSQGLADWIERQCMIGAHGEGASWYYYRQGYRLHHIFPDGAFTKNSPFLRVTFWRGLANGHLDRRTK